MDDDGLTDWDKRHLKRYDDLITDYKHLIVFGNYAFYTLITIPVAVVIALIVGRVFGFISD